MKLEVGEDGFTVTLETLGLFSLLKEENLAAWWLVNDTALRDCIREGQEQPEKLHYTAEFSGGFSSQLISPTGKTRARRNPDWEGQTRAGSGLEEHRN